MSMHRQIDTRCKEAKASILYYFVVSFAQPIYLQNLFGSPGIAEAYKLEI